MTARQRRSVVAACNRAVYNPGVHRPDPMTTLERSRQMALVRHKNTKPEMAVRRTLWRLGYRYRLHPSDVPGTPDIVFRRQRKALFVHGCFWHRHPGCTRTRTPKTRVHFWTRKFQQTVTRDRLVRRRLTTNGWTTLVIWECASERPELLETRLRQFLGDI